MNDMSALTKICKICEAQLPLTEFHKHSSTRDRLETRCKRCRRELAQRHYEANQGAILARCADYYAEHRAEVLKRINESNHRRARGE